MISVTFLAVDDGEGVNGTSLKIHQLEVCLRMPDGEGAIVGDGVEEIAAVRRKAGVTDRALCLLL